MIHATVNWVIGGSGNCLSPARQQFITRTNNVVNWQLDPQQQASEKWKFKKNTKRHLRNSQQMDPFHKSRNACVPYAIMQHFVTKICTWVHISVAKCCIVRYLSDALWDLWNRSIGSHFWSGLNVLTHCGLVTPYVGIDVFQHWFR